MFLFILFLLLVVLSLMPTLVLQCVYMIRFTLALTVSEEPNSVLAWYDKQEYLELTFLIFGVLSYFGLIASSLSVSPAVSLCCLMLGELYMVWLFVQVNKIK